MGQLTQVFSPRDNSGAPAFKALSIKSPDSFDVTKGHTLRGFIQSYQLIFHNYPENFFSDRNKALYSTSFPTGRAGKLIEPYISNISNEDPSCLLKNCKLIKTHFFNLFVDPNEVMKAERELDNLRMKERGHVSLYIAYLRRLISIIGNWGERAYVHVYGRGLESRPLDKLASHPGNFDTLQELIGITLELDTRYHERQKENGSHQENKPPFTGPNSFRPVLRFIFQEGEEFSSLKG
ncbi:hypothetical protein O181_101348 [Austropuccinia psidii MF-1]|uniref:Uncharacterized protein n=1 Tax=Austropuccinia psidii MF-1 TaxID=1389203 RepID=A0A9Q3PH13_9BASI|nr:hypothetical protein [Austropuccinia psidii MF-1]